MSKRIIIKQTALWDIRTILERKGIPTPLEPFKFSVVLKKGTRKKIKSATMKYIPYDCECCRGGGEWIFRLADGTTFPRFVFSR